MPRCKARVTEPLSLFLPPLRATLATLHGANRVVHLLFEGILLNFLSVPSRYHGLGFGDGGVDCQGNTGQSRKTEELHVDGIETGPAGLEPAHTPLTEDLYC